VTDHEDAIAKLYAVPLNAFTRERDALASALTKSNRAAEAKAVRQLRRPSAPLWAANQLAHADAERLGAYLDAVAEVRQSQLRDPRAAAEGLARQRRELQHLVRRAGDLLARDGARATPDTLRRISDTLLGAAVDADRAGELRHGRLQQELAAPGFEVLAGGGGVGHLELVRGGKSAAVNTPRVPRDHAAQQKEEAARQRRDAERTRAEAAARERKEAAARERQEAEARRREEAEAREREMAERRAAVEQVEQEIRELSGRLAAARRRLAELRRAAKSASRRRPMS